MLVNITGRGVIPGLRCIAPVYNKNVDRPLVQQLLNFNNFRVYKASTGQLITKSNIARLYAENAASTISTKSSISIKPKTENLEHVTHMNETSLSDKTEDTVLNDVVLSKTELKTETLHVGESVIEQEEIAEVTEVSVVEPIADVDTDVEPIIEVDTTEDGNTDIGTEEKEVSDMNGDGNTTEQNNSYYNTNRKHKKNKNRNNQQ